MATLQPAAARLQAAVQSRLQQSGKLFRYSLSEVAQHCTPEDAWIACFGKASPQGAEWRARSRAWPLEGRCTFALL